MQEWYKNTSGTYAISKLVKSFKNQTEYFSQDNGIIKITLLVVGLYLWYQSHSKRIPSETQRITSNIPVITIGDLGVVLTPSDLLASSSHNIYQSTFLKVDQPQWPKIPCADRCDEAVMASIACWENEEVYTPTYVAGRQVNRTRCMRFCFERPACVGVSSKRNSSTTQNLKKSLQNPRVPFEIF